MHRIPMIGSTTDLKLCFKIINNLRGLDPANLFTFAPSTLSHEFKLIKSICRNNWLLNFLFK